MTVTREMISAAHAETMKHGDVILSAELLIRIYEAMATRKPVELGTCCRRYESEIDHARTISMRWASTAIDRSNLLREAREFVLAYIAQCDVPCGIEGAQDMLRRINDHVAQVQEGPEA